VRQTLALPGCDVAYSDEGETGPAVLFLHGAGADHVMFDAQVRSLRATGRRFVTWDMRAHGLSQPNTADITAECLIDDAEKLIGRLGLSGCVLVGHSLGGNLAQELVRRSPASYAALVVIDATWNAGPLSWLERQLLRLAAPSLRLIPRASLARVLARASAVTPEAQADLQRAFGQVPPADFLAVWRATTSFVHPRPGYRAPLPLLLIRGELDRTGNISSAMPRWARHDGVDEVVIPNAGHVPTQDAPDAVTAALTTFLATLPASA
jgi:3-oxoadipate enol-lactonase